MLRLDWSEKFDKWLNLVSGVSPIIVATVGAVLKIEDGYFKSPIFLAIISSVRNRAWWIILLFSVIGILAQVIRARIGTPVVWQTVQYLLDQYREELFERGNSGVNDPRFFHRITLFKHVKWHWGFVRWPWSGWMIPVARSGHKTRSRIAKFFASSDAPDKAEGIADRLGHMNVRFRFTDCLTSIWILFLRQTWMIMPARGQYPENGSRIGGGKRNLMRSRCLAFRWKSKTSRGAH